MCCVPCAPRRRHGCERNDCARSWRSREAWDISTHRTSWASMKQAMPHRAHGNSSLRQVRERRIS